MATITGIWEQLPDHGEKPVVVRDCEKLERELQALKIRVKTVHTLHHQALKLAVAEIGNHWTRQEIGAAIFPLSLDLAEML